MCIQSKYNLSPNIKSIRYTAYGYTVDLVYTVVTVCNYTNMQKKKYFIHSTLVGKKWYAFPPLIQLNTLYVCSSKMRLSHRI